MDDRWRDVGDFEDRARVAGGDAAVTVHVGDGVGVVHHALEPVLGEQHGDAEVVHEASDGREHVLGRVRVERGRRFVEHERARVRGEHGTDRDSLLLPARERAERPGAELGDPEEVERLLDALAHHVGPAARAAPSRRRAPLRPYR